MGNFLTEAFSNRRQLLMQFVSLGAGSASPRRGLVCARLAGAHVERCQANKPHVLASPGLIVTSALAIWKTMILATGSESPVVVVLSGSMEVMQRACGLKIVDWPFIFLTRRPNLAPLARAARLLPG